MTDEALAELKTIRQEMVKIRTLAGEALFALRDAQAEIPEKMRRFTNYMHDLHDIKYMYEEHGIPVPAWIMREMERCDDRFRQLLTELHLDGGAFEKVRREMAKDPANRWDHTRLLTGVKDETRQSNPQSNGLDESRTEKPSGEPSSGLTDRDQAR